MVRSDPAPQATQGYHMIDVILPLRDDEIISRVKGEVLRIREWRKNIFAPAALHSLVKDYPPIFLARLSKLKSAP
jgi:hypothetical protein